MFVFFRMRKKRRKRAKKERPCDTGSNMNHRGETTELFSHSEFRMPNTHQSNCRNNKKKKKKKKNNKCEYERTLKARNTPKKKEL